MAQLLLLAIIVGALVLWLSPELKQRLRASLPRILPWALVAVLVLLVVSGRLHWLVAAGGGGLALLQRLVARWLRTNDSRLETRYLKLYPGKTTTPLDGAVKAGRFAGRRLSGMDEAELQALSRELQQADEASSRLLQAYLDHTYGVDWRQGQGEPDTGEMTTDEAYAILGLAPGAESSAIVAAHRRLMQRLHPDRGGSDYLAARINEAKRRLLGS